jgi:hypothetical protein
MIRTKFPSQGKDNGENEDLYNNRTQREAINGRFELPLARVANKIE